MHQKNFESSRAQQVIDWLNDKRGMLAAASGFLSDAYVRTNCMQHIAN